MDLQDKEDLPPNKEGEGEISNLMNTWKHHSINGTLRKKKKQMTMLFPIEPTQSIRIALDQEEQVMTKIMAT